MVKTRNRNCGQIDEFERPNDTAIHATRAVSCRQVCNFLSQQISRIANDFNPIIVLVRIITELLSFRYGQRETAGKIIEDMLATGDSNFNHLHKEVLLFNNENLRPFREISVRKKPWDNMQVRLGRLFLIERLLRPTLKL